MFSVWKNISISLFLHCGVTVATLWSEIWVNISFSFILKAETLPCKPLCCCYVCLKCVKTRVLEINYLNSVSVPRKWEWCSGRSVARSHRCHWSLSHDETLSAVSCWDNVTSWTFPKLQHGRCVCGSDRWACVNRLNKKNLSWCHQYSGWNKFVTSDLCVSHSDGPGAEGCHQPHLWRYHGT